ncbi:MAG: branched-chain amino acid ABC transporter permease [Thermoleophilia bacterium]
MRDRLLPGSVGERAWPLLGPALIVVALALLSLLGSEALERKATFMLINLVFVVGLYVFVGNSGVLSFGHASFMGLGAYTVAILTSRPQVKRVLIPDAPDFLRTANLNTILAILLAILVAAAFAAIIALPLMRLSGLAAGIATLAVLLVVNVVLSRWEALTGGLTSFSSIRRDVGVFSALIWALIAMAVAYLYQRSRFGLRLRGTREDALAARSLGISVVRERSIAFVVSGGLVGLSGALYAQFLGTITPTLFFLSITFTTIAMLVIGGINSLAGAVVGAVVISGLSEGLREVEKASDTKNITEIVLALILLGILIVRPRGLTGGREFRWPPFGRGGAAPSGPAAPTPERPTAATGQPAPDA